MSTIVRIIINYNNIFFRKFKVYNIIKFYIVYISNIYTIPVTADYTDFG